MRGRKAFRILISSSGRRVQLLRAFREAAEKLLIDLEVWTGDSSDLAPAARFSDRHLKLPIAADASFVDVVRKVCSDGGIDLLVPTSDLELLTLALAKEHLQEVGTWTCISSVDVVRLAQDKVRTHAFFQELGLPVPQQCLAASRENVLSLKFPAFAKPRKGSGSIGVQLLRDQVEAIDFLTRTPATDLHRYIVQEAAVGEEYTVSLFFDQHGKCLAEVPRKRLEVRSGEVSKAVTEANSKVLDVAKQVSAGLVGARGPVNLQLFFHLESGRVAPIEINARFGGGDPLAWRAGANAPYWLLQEATGQQAERCNDWKSGLLMLRYDSAVYEEFTPELATRPANETT